MKSQSISFNHILTFLISQNASIITVRGIKKNKLLFLVRLLDDHGDVANGGSLMPDHERHAHTCKELD